METSKDQPPVSGARNSGGDIQGKGLTPGSEETDDRRTPEDDALQEPPDSTTTED